MRLYNRSTTPHVCALITAFQGHDSAVIYRHKSNALDAYKRVKRLLVQCNEPFKRDNKELVVILRNKKTLRILYYE